MTQGCQSHLHQAVGVVIDSARCPCVVGHDTDMKFQSASAESSKQSPPKEVIGTAEESTVQTVP